MGRFLLKLLQFAILLSIVIGVLAGIPLFLELVGLIALPEELNSYLNTTFAWAGTFVTLALAIPTIIGWVTSRIHGTAPSETVRDWLPRRLATTIRETLAQTILYHHPWKLTRGDSTITCDQLVQRTVHPPVEANLLILGKQGTGKTTLLREVGLTLIAHALDLPGTDQTTLLRKLNPEQIEQIKKAKMHPGARMPIIFNLSSWATHQKPLDEWLVERLQIEHLIGKKPAQALVAQKELLLLLDGLDEVAQAQRADCLRAINTFRERFRDEKPPVQLVVCCRSTEYAEIRRQGVELERAETITVHPLDRQQVDAIIDGQTRDRAVIGLKSLLQNDNSWYDLLQTPLLLNLALQAYAGKSVQELAAIPPEARQDRIFRDFINRMFSLEEKAYLLDPYHKQRPSWWRRLRDRLLPWREPRYCQEECEHWLAWLATKMDNETGFLVERMQPTLLASPDVWDDHILGKWLNWLGIRWHKGINPSEVLRWSWPGAWLEVRKEMREILFDKPLDMWIAVWFGLGGFFIFGLSGFIFFGPVAGLVFGLGGGLFSALTALIVAILARLFGALISAPMFGLVGGLESTELSERRIPNEGIQLSRYNALRGGLVFALVSSVLVGLAPLLGVLPFGRLNIALWVGLVGAVLGAVVGGLGGGLRYGGAAVIKHWTLCRLLAREGNIPFNYVRFLNTMCNLQLLQREGGTYRFRHEMVQSYFARLGHQQPQTDEAVPATAPGAQAPG